MPDRPATIQDIIRAEAKAANVSPELALAVAEQESGFKQDIPSPKGAIGIMQLMPETAKKYGVDPSNQIENVRGGVKHLRYLGDVYKGDVSKMLAAYNAGEGAVATGRLPEETQKYVPGVIGRIGKFKTAPAEKQATKTTEAAVAAKPPARSTVKDVAIGAAKGVGSTVTNLGNLIRKVPGVSALDRLGKPITFSITPDNFAQTVGKTGEQVGEFFLPSSMVGKAETAIVGLLPAGKWALALARAVPEAVSAYGVSKAQGDPNAGVSAAVGGMTGGASKLLQRAGPALKGAAERGVGSAFQVGSDKRMVALAKRVAPDVLSGKHGSVFSMTMRGVEERAERMAGHVGEQIEEQVKQYGKLNFGDTIDGIVNQMETAKDAYRVVVPAEDVLSHAGELTEKTIMFDAGKVNAINRLQRTMRELKDYGVGTLDNLIGVRRAWDQVVSGAGGFAERGRTGTRAGRAALKDQTAGWAHREGTRAIRQVLSDPAHTDLKKLQALNAQFNFWTTIQDLSEGALGKQADPAGRMAKALGIATGALLGEQTSQRTGYGGTTGMVVGALAGTAGGAKLGNLVVAASRSPGFRLASAQVKNSIANALMSGQVELATRLLAPFAAGTVAGQPTSKGTQP